MENNKRSLMSQALLVALDKHISNERLPDDFMQTVQDYYWPIVCDVIDGTMNINNTASNKKQRPHKPYFLGIQGTQGSGKSTFASFIKLILETEFSKKCLVLSLDDFYLTKAERQALSNEIHPLLLTRGVPGTHDTGLLKSTLQQINTLKPGQSIEVVTFNKALDDRASKTDWQTISEPQDVVILEGWCVGVSAQSEQELLTPINELESNEDADRQWRCYVNEQINQHYQAVYDQFDGFVMLAAPSFECVFQWRTKQEQKLIARLKEQGKGLEDTMSAEQIKRFISHYQRLTEHGLKTLPEKANWQLILQPSHVISQLIRSV